MWKLFSALLCTACLAGLALAGEVTLVKYDAKTRVVTVKEGDAEKTYKVTDKTKYSQTTKDGAVQVKFEEVEKRLSNEKNAGKMKLDITTDKDTITELKYRGGGKGKN